MTLNIKKLCVGAQSHYDLYVRQEYIREKYKKTIHITRMYPKRSKELIDGGSIYWVIKGKLCIRQKILKIERFIDINNIKRCKFELDEELFLTIPFKERPFQGWRYLEKKDTPEDIKKLNINNLDDENQIISELHELGVV